MSGLGARLSAYLEFTRPFTLLPPLAGMLSGAFSGLGALAAREGVSFSTVLARELDGGALARIAAGAALAATLNAGSNILNQWTDLANDRINKPHRPLPSGRIGGTETAVLVLVLYGVALALAAAIRPGGRSDTLWVTLAGALATVAYSVPPLRTKRFGTWANGTIALARGCLLKVAGWSCVAAVLEDPEPWFLGGLFAFFLFGAAATKDFADMPGDRAAGCSTWPLRFGTRGAARLMAPFFVVPWLLAPLGALVVVGGRPLLSADPAAVVVLALLLAGYGVWIARLVLRDPDALARRENHPSWTHMYLQMIAAQIGFVVAYWF